MKGLVVVLAALVAVTLAGCTERSQYPGAHTGPVGEVAISVMGEENGIVERNDSFVLHGEVTAFNANRSFEDVRVVFYDKNRSVIQQQSIGRVELPGRYPVTMESAVTPQYIVVESPQLLAADGITVLGLKHYRDGQYIQYAVSNESKFN